MTYPRVEPWQPEQIAEALKMANEGYTALQIGIAIRKTRNAVAGFLHRFRAKGGKTGYGSHDRKSLAKAIAKEVKKPDLAEKAKKPPKAFTASFRSGRDRHEEKQAPMAIREIKFADIIAEPNLMANLKPVPFTQTTKYHCKWILNDDHPKMCCGLLTVENKPWCKDHLARVYTGKVA